MKPIRESHVRKVIQQTIDAATSPSEAFLFPIETGGRDGPNNRIDRSGKQAGAPDLMLIFKGKAIGVEVKLPGKKQQPNQVEFERKMKMAGGGYHVIHSPEEALDIISQLRKEGGWN